MAVLHKMKKDPAYSLKHLAMMRALEEVFGDADMKLAGAKRLVVEMKLWERMQRDGRYGRWRL